VRWREIWALPAVRAATVAFVLVLVAAFVVLQKHGPAGASGVTQAPFGCPPPAAPDVVDRAGDTLPTGARAAVLCYRDGHDAWYPPSGTLTSDVDSVVRAANAQRVHDPSSGDGCGGVGAEAWAMVVRYAHGTRTITGDNGGCWDLHVGTTQRFGSRKVFDVYLHALERQRAHGTATHAATTLGCPTTRVPPSSPLASPSTMVKGVICTHLGPQPQPVALNRSQVTVLRHDFATESGRRINDTVAARCDSSVLHTPFVISGVDRWGDRFVVSVSCGHYSLTEPMDRHVYVVRPLPSTVRTLTPLVGT
jgi:hypothetical protein